MQFRWTRSATNLHVNRLPGPEFDVESSSGGLNLQQIFNSTFHLHGTESGVRCSSGGLTRYTTNLHVNSSPEPESDVKSSSGGLDLQQIFHSKVYLDPNLHAWCEVQFRWTRFATNLHVYSSPEPESGVRYSSSGLDVEIAGNVLCRPRARIGVCHATWGEFLEMCSADRLYL